MCELYFAGLAVVDRAAVQISANRDAQYQRTGERAVRTPSQRRHLVADLHHRRPDVIEKLHLGHWLQSARGHTDGAARDRGLRQRRFEHTTRSELRLQPVRHLELASRACDLRQVLRAAAISHILPEHYDAWVAPHLFAQR